MNDDDWDMERDGGALRLYPDSQHFISPSEALAACAQDFVDISPLNGRLLIFDSCLVHSVRPNTSPTKRRRALTLWINRPNDSGVKGEQYF
jgi:ectoine hydroxylase-related dioxygenase (phytanoyl-CoA dioxygenase family)